MKGTCAILDGEIITSPRSPLDSTVVYQLGLPKIREIEYEVFFVDFCFYHDILQPFKAVMYFNFYFFFASFAAIKQLQNAPPHLFFRNRAPSPCPSHGRHRILVGCCVPRFNGSHLRPWPHLTIS